MRLPPVSPALYRRITGVALWLLILIVVTGAAVRLTSSGLGCTDWPTCKNHHVVAPFERHALIEFGNRTLTGLVSLAVIAAVLASLARTPRRRDLTWLSVGLVVGVVAQIVLGGVVVLTHLNPVAVQGHFVLSALLVLDAVVLHFRAGQSDDPGTAPAVEPVEPVVLWLSRGLVGLASCILLAGTVVTGAGPHSGQNVSKGKVEYVKRLPITPHDAAQIHGGLAIAFLITLLALVWQLRKMSGSERLLRRAEGLLLVTVLQGGVGYLQYFTGVPPLLVALHVLGSMILWVLVLQFHLGLPVGGRDSRESPGDPTADGSSRDLVTR